MFAALTVIYSWDMIHYNQRWDWLYNLTVFEFRYSFHGSLFSLPIIYAAYIFRWRGAVIAWSLSMAVVIPRILSYKYDPLGLFENVFYLLAPVLLVLYIALERNWREKEKKSLAEREEERRLYTVHVLKAQEDERRRIARELHDDPTQTLLVVANRTQALVDDGLDAQAPDKRKELEWIRDTAISVSEELKRICLDLRPSVLDDLGLIAALRWIVAETNRTGTVQTSIEVAGSEIKLSPEREVTLFRIVQEALNNIRRHSEASAASVRVQFSEEQVRITISDNGKGFAAEKILNEINSGSKLGLRGMKERTHLLNGSIEISSDPGRGTLIIVEMPAKSEPGP